MNSRTFTLGIEGGGTKTTWCLVGADGAIVADGTLGCGNVALMDDGELRALFREIAGALPDPPAAIGAGLAGTVNPAAGARVEALLAEAFPLARTIVVDHDGRSGFLAAHPSGTGVLVIAGTGSFVLGCREGRWARSDGRGHVAGDAGSAYHLAERGLRAVFTHYDETGRISALGSALLAATCLNSLDDLSGWVTQNSASKKTIAALARTVVEAGEAGCPLALACVVECAEALVRSVASVTRRLEMKRPSVALSGGLLEKSKIYRETFSRQLAVRLTPSEIRVNTTPGALGAARMAGASFAPQQVIGQPVADAGCSDTEQRNPRTRNLERLTVTELVKLFLDESERVGPALRAVAPQLVKATELVVAALQNGGRLFYIGAGTSGRLGVLDASEIPPTFGVKASNAKLRDRATRIVMELTGWDESKAGAALARHGWNIRSALASVGGACPKVTTSRIFPGGMGVSPSRRLSEAGGPSV